MSPIIHMIRIERGQKVISCQPMREKEFCKVLIKNNRASEDPQVVTCKECRRQEMKRAIQEVER